MATENIQRIRESGTIILPAKNGDVITGIIKSPTIKLTIEYRKLQRQLADGLQKYEYRYNYLNELNTKLEAARRAATEQPGTVSTTTKAKKLKDAGSNSWDELIAKFESEIDALHKELNALEVKTFEIQSAIAALIIKVPDEAKGNVRTFAKDIDYESIETDELEEAFGFFDKRLKGNAGT